MIGSIFSLSQNAPKFMRVDNTKFYGNAFAMTPSAKNQNSIKNSTKSDVSKKDPLQEILDKIEKLKKQLADLNARIVTISSNSDEMSKELLAQLNAKAAQINAQIAALYEQIFKMCKIKA